MFVLIWSLLGLSFVHCSFGVPQYSSFQPAAYKFNQPAVPFNQPAAYQFNQPAVPFNQPSVPFNQPAVPFNPPAVQYPSPVNPTFDTAQPNFQIPSSFQGLDTTPSPSGYNKDAPKCQFSDVVQNFKDNFVQSISSSQRYKDAFNLKRVEKERAASIWYERIRSESVAAGEKDPDFSAFSNAQAVRDNYEYIDSDYHLKVFGYSLGEYLYQKRVLTADNVDDLAEKLAQTMRDSIDENSNGSSEGDLYGILKGCENFLTSLHSEDLSYACDAIFGELFYILKNSNCH